MPLRIESPSASPHPASTQPAIVFVRLSIVSIEPSRKPAPGLRPPTKKSPPFTVAMRGRQAALACRRPRDYPRAPMENFRSEEHTSELQSLMRISYAVFCLKKKILHHHHREC